MARAGTQAATEERAAPFLSSLRCADEGLAERLGSFALIPTT